MGRPAKDGTGVDSDEKPLTPAHCCCRLDAVSKSDMQKGRETLGTCPFKNCCHVQLLMKPVLKGGCDS